MAKIYFNKNYMQSAMHWFVQAWNISAGFSGHIEMQASREPPGQSELLAVVVSGLGVVVGAGGGLSQPGKVLQ